jgi:hypothetical protein
MQQHANDLSRVAVGHIVALFLQKIVLRGPQTDFMCDCLGAVRTAAAL